MVKSIYYLLLALTISAQAAAAETLKPFVLASKSAAAVDAVQQEVEGKLGEAGFRVVGSYAPFADAVVIGITSEAILGAAAGSEFGGYAAVQRVALTKMDGEVQVSYTNPTYMAHAYRLKKDLSAVTAALASALGNEGTFGPEKGLSPDDLHSYHYMFGMPYFDDSIELAAYDSYQAAVAAVEGKLDAGVGGTRKVWRVDVPGTESTLFGVGMKKPEGGNKYMDDAYIMSEIDFKPTRSTAHLPYEMLVAGSRVYTLPAQFRIAINFPDLKMMGDNSFMNIMESPDAIKAALASAAGAKKEKQFIWE